MASKKENVEKVRPTVNRKDAFTITGEGDDKFWNRIGVAFVNKDGSINVKLAALPVNGEIHLRDYVPKEDAGLSED